jgi:hypothetical protein
MEERRRRFSPSNFPYIIIIEFSARAAPLTIALASLLTTISNNEQPLNKSYFCGKV